jgi:hypothetical protein
MDESINNDALNFAAEATAWSKVGTPEAISEPEERAQPAVVCDIFGNPFRPVQLDAFWLTQATTSLARATYNERLMPSGHLDPARLAVLADAPKEVACTEAILDHLRSPGPDVRGCWPVDLVPGKE